MSSFSISTQKSSWLINEEVLTHLRWLAIYSKESKLNHPNSVPTVKFTNQQILSLSDSQKIQLDKEEIFISRYTKFIYDHFKSETKIEKKDKSQRRIKGVPLHWRVSATAIVYFRRFYLTNSLYHYDPRLIM